jgi:hypothetical protein
VEHNTFRTCESFSDTDNQHTENGKVDNQTGCDDECKADNESNPQLAKGIKCSERPEHRVVSAAEYVPGLVLPLKWSMNNAEKGLMTAGVMENKRNNGNKKK